MDLCHHGGDDDDPGNEVMPFCLSKKRSSNDAFGQSRGRPSKQQCLEPAQNLHKDAANWRETSHASWTASTAPLVFNEPSPVGAFVPRPSAPSKMTTRPASRDHCFISEHLAGGGDTATEELGTIDAEAMETDVRPRQCHHVDVASGNQGPSCWQRSIVCSCSVFPALVWSTAWIAAVVPVWKPSLVSWRAR